MVKKVKVSVDKLVERIKNKGIVKIIPEPGFNLFVYHPLEQYLRKERVVYDLKGNIEEDLKINLNKIEVVYPLNQRDFTYFYISTALKLAEQGPTIGEFDEGIRRVVAKRFDISTEIVKSLHHLFHWSFFNVNANSPLECVQLGKSVRENYVRYKGEPSEEDLSTLSEFILKKYGDMLFRRIEKVSISPQ